MMNNMLARAIAIGLISMSALVIPNVPTWAAGDCPDGYTWVEVRGGLGGQCKKVTTDDGEEGSGSGSGDGSAVVAEPPVSHPRYKYAINCPNSTAQEPGDDMCEGATAGCERGEQSWKIFRQIVEPPAYAIDDEAWEHIATRCLSSDELDPGERPQITEQMLYDEALAVAPGTNFSIEPEATSYVNVPNNFAVSRGNETGNAEIFGIPVQFVYTPQSYGWNFGDGATANGPGVSGARVGQSGAVEHEYRRVGTFNVTVTRSFEVVASVAGQTITLSQPVSSTSDAQPLEIDEIQSVVTRVR